MIVYRGIDHLYLESSCKFIQSFPMSTIDNINGTLDFTDYENQVVLEITVPIGTPIININELLESIDEKIERLRSKFTK